MARFVVLKGGQSHTVFEFGGNIARVGAGEAMDLTLEGAQHQGDLFFLTKSHDGYDLERRNPDLDFTVNGQPGGDRVSLKDGDKIAFEDFMIIVTYPPTIGGQAKEQAAPEKEGPPEPKREQPVSKDTAPVVPPEESKPAPPAAEEKPQEEEQRESPPPAEPPKKPAGSEKETMLIDVEELERRAKQQQEQKSASADQPASGQQRPQQEAPQQQPPRQERPKPEPPKPPPTPRGSEKETRIISSDDIQDRHTRQQSQQPRTQPPKERTAEPPARESGKKQKIRAEYSLVGLSGQYKGRAQEVDSKEFVVGRDPNKADLVIDRNEKGELEKSISREHFVIVSSDDGLLYLVDKKSKLRTYINGRVIEPNQRESITPEDIISIPAPSGEVVFRLCYRGQENYEPIKKNKLLIPALILLAVIVVLVIILLVLLLGD